jgi:hypothetical protein
MKMDLSQEGLEMFFKDYQLKSLQVLLESGNGLFSRDVWIKVNQRRNESISRASIINFLNRMLDMDILSGTVLTGKGGHRTRYHAKMDEEQLKQYLKNMVKKRLKTMI